VAIFSGWVREKTYEEDWLIGRLAEEYVGYDKSFAKTQEDIVVLKRKIGRDSECYDAFASSPLARYLETLPTHGVKVRYRVVYDFYEPRTYQIERIGDFPGEAASLGNLGIGVLVGAERVRHNTLEPCFAW